MDDEISKIETEAAVRYEMNDWAGALDLQQAALTFNMSPLRRAQILRNVTGTYFMAGRPKEAANAAERL